MATAWNLKKVHSILDQKIKVDLNNIYRDLTNLNNNIELLADVDQTATAKNGEMIANFSGHKAVKYFTTLKANGGYYMKSEDFYTKAYKLCAQLVEKGQQRAVKDNNSKYKSYSKWSSTLPTNKKFTFQHAMYDRINEDVTNVSGNILTLKENVDSSYDK